MSGLCQTKCLSEQCYIIYIEKCKTQGVAHSSVKLNSKCYTLWAVCLYYVRVNICHQYDRHMYQPGFEPANS